MISPILATVRTKAKVLGWETNLPPALKTGTANTAVVRERRDSVGRGNSIRNVAVVLKNCTFCTNELSVRHVLEGLRGEDSVAELCRTRGYYRWSRDFLEAGGKKRLAGDTARAAT